MKSRIVSVAELDLGSAIEYYMNISPTVAARFLTAFGRAVRLIEKYPLIGRKLPNDVRQVVVSKFDYLVYYRIENNSEIVVHAVLHGRRDPEYVDERLRG